MNKQKVFKVLSKYQLNQQFLPQWKESKKFKKYVIIGDRKVPSQVARYIYLERS